MGKRLGVSTKEISLNTSNQEVLTNQLLPELKAGNSVIISTFSYNSKKGHIV